MRNILSISSRPKNPKPMDNILWEPPFLQSRKVSHCSSKQKAANQTEDEALKAHMEIVWNIQWNYESKYPLNVGPSMFHLLSRLLFNRPYCNPFMVIDCKQSLYFSTGMHQKYLTEGSATYFKSRMLQSKSLQDIDQEWLTITLTLQKYWWRQPNQYICRKIWKNLRRIQTCYVLTAWIYWHFTIVDNSFIFSSATFNGQK